MKEMLKQDPRKYKGYRSSGIRLNEPFMPELSKLIDGRNNNMLPPIHKFDQAHTVMQVEQGMLTREAGAAILKSLLGSEKEGVIESRVRVGGGLHSGEQYVIRDIGEEIGGQIHLGRSSGDLSSVGINVMQRNKLVAGMKAINRARRFLLEFAAQHLQTVMPGYTFGQQGQPLTFGYQMVAWAASLERDFERFAQTYRRINVSPAGSAIMVGSDFPIDRDRTAELLGFDAVHENCADSILNRSMDDILELPMVLSIIYHTMAKWADDIILWSTSEFQFIDVPDRYCGSSSIMMQKKNISGPAEIKGASSYALSSIVVAYHGLKGPTAWAVSERGYALEATWRISDMLVVHLDLLCQLLKDSRINVDKLLTSTGSYWAAATDLGGYLVRERGLAWRTAHQIVGIMIRLAEERGLSQKDVTAELLDEAAVAYHGTPVGLTQEEMVSALDPVMFVERRTMKGGTAAAEVQRQINVFKGRITEDEKLLRDIEDRLADADQKLSKAVSAIVNGG
jgi:argininosuccinate lyase